jgi:hypothetical protein
LKLQICDAGKRCIENSTYFVGRERQVGVGTYN